jgi:hypothetical protein
MRRENTLVVVQNHFDFARKNLENSLVVPTGDIHLQPRKTWEKSCGLLIKESVDKQWS